MSTDRNAIVKLAVDIYKNKVNTAFASKDMEENKRKLHEKLIEVNGGSSKLSYKGLRAGKHNGLFEIIEDVLANTTEEGLMNNQFFQTFAEFRNLAEGDENSFHVPDNSLMLVSEFSHGNWGARRQRINQGTNTAVPTTPRVIKAYEELRRLLADRIDIVEFVDKMQRSMLEDKLDLVYTTFLSGLASLPAAFTTTGAYTEDGLLDIIEHVQASNPNMDVMIVGTLRALRKVTTAVVSDSMREDVKNLGYYGTFNSYNMMRIPQSHTVGTYTFKISDNDLWVVLADTTPVKFCTEGEVILETGDMTDNKDATIDITLMENYGALIVINSLYGQYRIA